MPEKERKEKDDGSEDEYHGAKFRWKPNIAIDFPVYRQLPLQVAPA